MLPDDLRLALKRADLPSYEADVAAASESIRKRLLAALKREEELLARIHKLQTKNESKNP